METTTTLTLHEANRPDAPLIFILDGDSFRMDMSAAFRPGEAGALAQPAEPWQQALESFFYQLAGEIVRGFSGPFHVRDLDINVQGDTLTLQVWKRVQGLRLAPAVISLSGIDDPAAAANFADLVRERSLAALPPSRYRGLLDYWATWILGVLALLSGFISLGWWVSRRSRRD